MDDRPGDDELLAAFEAQIRRDLGPEQEGWVHERVGPVLRITAPAWTGRGGGVVCSDLGGLTGPEVDAVIADQVAYFAPFGRAWEWKTYAHDLPADLPGRLRRAGFEPEEEEALVIGRVDDVVAAWAGVHPPPEALVREPLDGDYDGITALRQAVWGGSDAAAMTDELVAEKAADPSAMTILVAVAGAQVVSAAWVRFHAGTEFASLWGGSTLSAWRRRGIYRTLVGRRAELARERGFHYLQVDASPQSRPVLERLGMRVVSTTTPYVWSPGARAADQA